MAYAIAAGKYRHSVTIQQKSLTTPDGMGSAAESWSTWEAGVRCDMAPYTGKEYWAAGQKQTEATMVFSMRYRSGLTKTMRITDGTRVWDIVSVVDADEMHRELHVMAVERSEGA